MIPDLSEFDFESLIAELKEQLPAILTVAGTVLAVIAVIVGIILLADYIMRSIAVARMAKKRNLSLWGLAWIPGLRLIVIGRIADHHDKKTVGRKHGFAVLLPILLLICLAAGGVHLCSVADGIREFVQTVSTDQEAAVKALFSLFGGSSLLVLASLAGTALKVFYSIAVYKLFEACKVKNTFLDMLLYLLVPFAAPIVLLAVSGSDSDGSSEAPAEIVFAE